MNKKKVFYTEAAYILGLTLLAMGAALMERADFGMSMVVAPAYLVYLKLSQFFSWFTFGMAEYCLQALILLLMGVILRRFQPTYLFSFCTAIVYGLILDFVVWLVGYLPCGGVGYRLAFYVAGLFACALGVALLFHTYIAPEAYELLVKEVAAQYHRDVAVVKTVYDCASCAVAVAMSFVFFGLWHFEGVKLGTILCALVNGWLIGKMGGILERRFEFRDALRRG